MAPHATWVLEQEQIMTGHDRSFPPRCTSGSCPIIITATQLMPCPNPALYLSIGLNYGPRMAPQVSWVLEPGQVVTGHNTSFPPICTSESYPIIISATHLMPWTNSSITSQYWTWLMVQNWHPLVSWVLEPLQVMIGHKIRFPPRWKSESYPIKVCAKHLMSQIPALHRNDGLGHGVKLCSRVFGCLSQNRSWPVVTWVSHLDIHLKAIR